jgi:hypothetical protein
VGSAELKMTNAVEQSVTFDAGGAALEEADVTFPDDTRGVVLFAHGNGRRRRRARA